MSLDASQSQGAITRYLWDFGDGTTGSTTTPTTTHSYALVGNYVVTLTVVDSSGNTDSAAHTVDVAGSAPKATFASPAAALTGATLVFDGSGSSTPNAGATITSYDWNWGDGTADGTGAKPTHSYATAGTYSVVLTVTDSAGETGSATHVVTVEDRPPVASFAALSTPQLAGTAASFDGSSSNDPDGTIVNYDWKWGDGTPDGSGPKPNHTFSRTGTFPVTLTVTDNSGNTSSVTQNVVVSGSAPTAVFSAPPEAPTATLLSFDGSGSTTPNTGATITSYDWSWGDGSVDGSGANPTHSYAHPGTYPVRLTVTDSAGDSGSVIHDVVVSPRRPTAAFNPTSATVLAGANVVFDGTQSSDPDGTIKSYSWNFGDGGSSTSAEPTHRYLEVGTFNVQLTVTDSFGNSSSISHQITVIAPPPLQTLVVTPVAAPALVKSGSPSTKRSGRVDPGQREFCPGAGPSCVVTITATSNAASRRVRVARSVTTVGPNGSMELTFRLSGAARSSLLRRGRLPVRITISVRRGNQTSARTLNLTLVPLRR